MLSQMLTLVNGIQMLTKGFEKEQRLLHVAAGALKRC